jgi:hypothetical protein
MEGIPRPLIISICNVSHNGACVEFKAPGVILNRDIDGFKVIISYISIYRSCYGMLGQLRT